MHLIPRNAEHETSGKWSIRSRSVGRLSAAVLTACVASVSVVSTASGQTIDRSHNRGTDTFSAQVCGLNVVITVQFLDNEIVRLDRNGFPLFQSTGQTTITYTNPLTNLSLVNRVAGVSSKDLSVTDNANGTITLRTAITGIPQRLTLPDGTVVVKDVGRVVFATVLDFNGTPSNPDDDTFISQTVESVSGPHPELASDFTLFCPTLIAALT